MTYRVGISGLGRGLGPADTFAVMPDCAVVAACDPEQTALDRFSQRHPQAQLFTDYEAMLGAGLDIVCVATPMPLHRAQTVAALEAGCHVLQEVTLAHTVDDCRAILAAVRAHPRQKFMLAENNCYLAYIMGWQKLWADGHLGAFMYAEAEYVHDIRHLLRNADGTPAWRASRPPIVYCTHSLGPLLKVTGERCVSAVGMHTGSKLEPELGHIDMEVALFQTSSGGVIKVLRAQAVAREPSHHSYVIYGTAGCLESSRPPTAPERTYAYFESVPYTRSLMEIPMGANVPHAPKEAFAGGHGTQEYYMIQDFMHCIRHDTPSPIDIDLALAMTLPGLCAHESATQGGKPVAVPDWHE